MQERSPQARRLLRDRVCARGDRSCLLELWSPWRLASSAALLSELRSFRRAAYQECTLMGAHRGAGLDARSAADPQAWHLLARRRETGELVGCIRFIVFERSRLADVLDLVLQRSGYRFSRQDRARFQMALCEYWAGWLRQSGPFLQIDGLAVAAAARRSALAPLLCLAANAFMRARGSRFGVVFGSEPMADRGMYEKAGCAPMALGPGSLPPLPDLLHGDRAMVMMCQPYALSRDLAAEVEQLHADFLEAQALDH